jgi:imidazolonepropionase-like amidohydrolase
MWSAARQRARRSSFFAIADEARRLGLPFAGHVPFAVTIEEAAQSGMRSIEHLANLRVSQDCSAAPSPQDHPTPCSVRYATLASRGVYQTPTMAFFHELPDLFSGAPLPHADYASDALLDLTRRNAAASALDARALASLRSRAASSLAVVRALLETGNGLLAGCDGLVPGFCLHDELEWMVRAGLSPIDALRTATINPARFLGREKTSGSIAIGKRADLVLLDADPRSDIGNVRRISAVVVRGRLLSKASLDGILAAHRRTAPPR